jgi:hypothetical protein
LLALASVKSNDVRYAPPSLRAAAPCAAHCPHRVALSVVERRVHNYPIRTHNPHFTSGLLKTYLVPRGAAGTADSTDQETPPMTYYIAKTGSGPFERVVPAVMARLKTQGFGVLSDIDVQATLKSKLGTDIPTYRGTTRR